MTYKNFYSLVNTYCIVVLIFFHFKVISLVLHVWLFCLHICKYTMSVQVPKEARRGCGIPVIQQLRVVMNYHVDPGSSMWAGPMQEQQCSELLRLFLPFQLSSPFSRFSCFTALQYECTLNVMQCLSVDRFYIF